MMPVIAVVFLLVSLATLGALQRNWLVHAETFETLARTDDILGRPELAAGHRVTAAKCRRRAWPFREKKAKVTS